MSPETPKSFDWSFRPFLLLGYATLAVLVLGLGGWGVMARISGAVIAMGTVEVEGNRQVVQHPVGGVVTEILARDGDRVAKGDVLLRLEGDAQRAEHATVEGQLFELVARQNRLERRGVRGGFVGHPDAMPRQRVQHGRVLRLIQERSHGVGHDRPDIVDLLERFRRRRADGVGAGQRPCRTTGCCRRLCRRRSPLRARRRSLPG